MQASAVCSGARATAARKEWTTVAGGETGARWTFVSWASQGMAA
ncbi:hypothetical protein [Streptomyces sp. NPDC002133]